jgi:hypothetical protein
MVSAAIGVVRIVIVIGIVAVVISGLGENNLGRRHGVGARASFTISIPHTVAALLGQPVNSANTSIGTSRLSPRVTDIGPLPV